SASSRRPSSSARCRPWPSLARGRRASTTCTRGGARVRLGRSSLARDAAAAPTPPDSATGAGTLYVVATPIGNLGDVTLRALETLRSVPLVAAEDTRIARRLFARYDITTRLTSFHVRSGPARLGELLAHLR